MKNGIIGNDRYGDKYLLASLQIQVVNHKKRARFFENKMLAENIVHSVISKFKVEDMDSFDKILKFHKNNFLHCLFPWEDNYINKTPADNAKKIPPQEKKRRYDIYKKRYDSKIKMSEFFKQRLFLQDLDWS